MDKLIEFLKAGNCRVSSGDRWLVWHGEEWVVLQRKYYARNNTTLYRGESLDNAVGILATDNWP